MQLRADDFGCVPDGRVLESVKVLAGSTRLDVLDGTLRPGDVGKHIAVPGAVDLVTTIDALVGRKDCKGTMATATNSMPSCRQVTSLFPAALTGDCESG